MKSWLAVKPWLAAGVVGSAIATSTLNQVINPFTASAWARGTYVILAAALASVAARALLKRSSEMALAIESETDARALLTRLIESALAVVRAERGFVLVQSTDGEATTDEALAALAAKEHATMVGVVSWSDRQRSATIRFVRVPDGRSRLR